MSSESQRVNVSAFWVRIETILSAITVESAVTPLCKCGKTSSDKKVFHTNLKETRFGRNPKLGAREKEYILGQSAIRIRVRGLGLP